MCQNGAVDIARFWKRLALDRMRYPAATVQINPEPELIVQGLHVVAREHPPSCGNKFIDFFQSLQQLHESDARISKSQRGCNGTIRYGSARVPKNRELVGLVDESGTLERGARG